MPDDSPWALVDTFTVEQAACLWAGVDPHLYASRRINYRQDPRDGTVAAYLQMLGGAVASGTIPSDSHSRGLAILGNYTKPLVTRDALKAFATSKNQRPAFLFGAEPPAGQAPERFGVRDGVEKAEPVTSPAYLAALARALQRKPPPPPPRTLSDAGGVFEGRPQAKQAPPPQHPLRGDFVPRTLSGGVMLGGWPVAVDGGEPQTAGNAEAHQAIDDEPSVVVAAAVDSAVPSGQAIEAGGSRRPKVGRPSTVAQVEAWLRQNPSWIHRGVKETLRELASANIHAKARSLAYAKSQLRDKAG